MAWTRYRPSKRAVFVLLMLASGLTLALPPRWTDQLKHVVQLLVFAQHPLRQAALRATNAVSNLDADPALGRLVRERQALQNALVSRHAEIDRLRAEIGRLSAIRERVVPPHLPLLRATIVADDIVASRDIVFTNRGGSRNVRRGDWVASGFFVDQGSLGGATPGQAVLAAETLVGRVDTVSPFISRVRLLTDPDAKLVEVRIGRFVEGDGGTAGRLDEVDYVCSLAGRGGGEMVIAYVPADLVGIDDPDDAENDKKRIRIGDSVFTAPGQIRIPVPMVVGRVARFESDPQKRLVYNVIVEPLVRPHQLDDVYIISAVPTGPIRILDN